jgi:hypothetical protein
MTKSFHQSGLIRTLEAKPSAGRAGALVNTIKPVSCIMSLYTVLHYVEYFGTNTNNTIMNSKMCRLCPYYTTEYIHKRSSPWNTYKTAPVIPYEGLASYKSN